MVNSQKSNSSLTSFLWKEGDRLRWRLARTRETLIKSKNQKLHMLSTIPSKSHFLYQQANLLFWTL